MSDKLKVETSWINLVNGVSQEEAPGLGHIGPGFRLPIGPDKGTLYVLVESLRGPQPDVERQVVDAIAEAYRRAPLGSITGALRQALTVANRQLYQANQAALSDQKIAVGTTCAVLRGADLFLAQVGPALAYMVHRGTLQRVPTDSPWLSPARAPTTPISAPLGALSDTDPLLVHFFLEPGDLLVLCSSLLVRYATEEEIRTAVTLKRDHALLPETGGVIALHQGEPQAVVQALEQLARGRDLLALAIAATSIEAEAAPVGEVAMPAAVPAPVGAAERARLTLAEGGRRLWGALTLPFLALAARLGLRPRPPEELAPPAEAIPPLEEVVPAPIPREPVQIPSLVPGEEASTLPPYLRGEAPPAAPPAPPLVEVAPEEITPVSREAPRPISQRAREIVGALRERLRPSAGVPEEEIAVEAPAAEVGEAPPVRRFRPTWPKLAVPCRWLLPALLVAGLIAILLLFLGVRWVQNRAETARLTLLLQQAEQKQASAATSADRATARQRLAEADALVAQALQRRPNYPQAVRLQDEIQSDLDKINAVVRIQELTTLMTFTTPASAPGRIVVVGIDVYVLDKGTQRLYRFLLAPNGNALQELKVDPVLVRRGDTVGTIVVGDLLDIFWLPGGGARRTDNLMCLESGGSLLEYAANRTPGLRSLPLADSKAWLKVRAAAGYSGNAYLLDTQRNAILKYVPTSSGYTNPPLGYLDAAVRADLTNTVDVAIDGDVYVLVLDGQVWRFRLGKILPFPRSDLDKPTPNPASLFTSEAAQSVYVVDAANKRIVQFSKEGVFQRQFRYAGFDGAFDSLRNVFVDEERSVMYITSGDKLYLARIPR